MPENMIFGVFENIFHWTLIADKMEKRVFFVMVINMMLNQNKQTKVWFCDTRALLGFLGS